MQHHDTELKFRLPAIWKKQLAELGKQENRNVSDMARICVEEYLQKHLSRNPPNPKEGNELTTPTARSRTNETPAVGTITVTFDLDTLFYPADIAHVIGMSAPEINALKAKGCKFYGKKTTIRWVREFINPSDY